MTDDETQHITVSEAASWLGVSERTIRRRIKEGQLQAASIETPQGHTWRIDPASLPNHPALPPGTPPGAPGNHPAGPGNHPATTRQADDATRQPADTPEVLELVRLVDRLQRDNQQLAGQLGFTQAKLQEAEKTIALLMAPKDEPEPAELEQPAEPKRAWWQRLRGR